MGCSVPSGSSNWLRHRSISSSVMANEVFGATCPRRVTLSGGYRPKLRSRSELATTSTELAAIAAPASIGLSRPRAATGMPTAL